MSLIGKSAVLSLSTAHALIAHRSDISTLNIMLDGKVMYKDPWHPIVTIKTRDYSRLVKHYSRTEKPPKYHFIDFGLSRKYNPDDGPPMELPVFGGDKSVPEFQDDGYDKPADPFRTDIYYLGSVIRETFLDVCTSFFSVNYTDSTRILIQEIPWYGVYTAPDQRHGSN